MAEVLPFPHIGELFTDVRGGERTMRVSHHPDRELLVFSIWSGGTCRASFQLPLNEMARLSDLLGGVVVSDDEPDQADLPKAC